MRSKWFLIIICLFIAACGPRKPTESRMEQDVQILLLANEREKIAAAKKAEQKRIRKLTAFFTPQQLENRHIKALLVRNDFEKDLRDLEHNIAYLQVVSVKRERNTLRGIAEYRNEFDSSIQVEFSYTRTETGWEFVRQLSEPKVILSRAEKKEELKNKLSMAIMDFSERQKRYPHSLQELVPRYIAKINPADWEYDPATGEIN